MFRPVRRIHFLLSCLLMLAPFARTQVMTIPTSGFGNMGVSSLGVSGLPVGLDLLSSQQMINNLYGMTANMKNSRLGEASSSAVSKLDLKAPGKAHREYEKGYQLLMRKEFQNAIEHLLKSTEIYPQFVAAHNALGSAYLDLGQNDQARNEFSQAVALDDHLPNSYLNLGVAQLAVKDYPSAEESFKKASSIAPLDLSFMRALAYGQFVNKNYPAVIATAQQVHKREHEGSAIVHYFAAGAWEQQGKDAQAQRELQLLIREDPKSAAAAQARQLLQQIRTGKIAAGTEVVKAAPSPTFTFEPGKQPTTEEATLQARKLIEDLKENKEIADAEGAEAQPASKSCEPADAAARLEAKPEPLGRANNGLVDRGGVLRTSVDEVAMFFTVTDHGKSVTDLTGSEISIRDDHRPPSAILGFHNEADLPLHLGLIIDTSDSVARRFSFEQNAAIHFLQKAVTGADDLAFVIGVNNSVLLVQDFTADQSQLSRAIGQLVPSGGTALWDAVKFGAEKLSEYAEARPTARVLVVISDGENNSSRATLKEAIERAQRGEVAVYTVSTRDYDTEKESELVGDHALRSLAQLTGGVAFAPGSVRRLNGSLGDLQQVLRGRYLVAYKAASFQRDGRYRPIEISAEKNGRKLKVYARKGYYALTEQPSTTAP